MERPSRAAIIPVAFTWSDVGNWSSLEEVAPMDKCRQCRERAGRRSSKAAIRCSMPISELLRRSAYDMVVVDTPDATLVCPKSRAQDVKQVVEILKKQGAPEHLEHLNRHSALGLVHGLGRRSGIQSQTGERECRRPIIPPITPPAERALGRDRRNRASHLRQRSVTI